MSGFGFHLNVSLQSCLSGCVLRYWLVAPCEERDDREIAEIPLSEKHPRRLPQEAVLLEPIQGSTLVTLLFPHHQCQDTAAFTGFKVVPCARAELQSEGAVASPSPFLHRLAGRVPRRRSHTEGAIPMKVPCAATPGSPVCGPTMLPTPFMACAIRHSPARQVRLYDVVEIHFLTEA